MKAKFRVLFFQEQQGRSDTRFVVTIEKWCMGRIKRYILLSGEQYYDAGWDWCDNSRQEVLDNFVAEAHHIRRAIQVYDELVGAVNE